MTRQALLDLAARCEAATEPSRGIDLEIMRYVMNIGGDPKNALHYTASLDAAMTLVPEGCGPVSLVIMGSGQAFIDSADPCGGYVGACECATTPALALTAACLKALAQENEHD